jgi:phage baseplate assembly protein W
VVGRLNTGAGRWRACAGDFRDVDVCADRDTASSGAEPDEGDGNMSQVDHPFHFDDRGRTADTGADDHIRDLIEEVLFTSPGERVNRPTFGCGVLQLVFAPNSEELAAASQLLIQGGLQQWLDDLIQVQSVSVENDDAVLRISVQYLAKRSQVRQVADFTVGGTQA